LTLTFPFTATNHLGAVGQFIDGQYQNALLQFGQQYTVATETPQALQRAAHSMTARGLVANANLHGDVQLRHALQRFHPRTTAVQANLGSGTETVGVGHLRLHRAEQRQQRQQQQQQQEPDESFPAFALPPTHQLESTGPMGSQRLGEVNRNFGTNSNKRKHKAATVTARQTHRHRRNGLGPHHPLSEMKEEDDDEIEILHNNSNAFFSPAPEDSQYLVQMGCDEDIANDILAQNGGDVNGAANFLIDDAAPPPYAAAPPPYAATIAAEPIDPNEKDKADKIEDRRKKFKGTSFKGAKNSPREKALYCALAKKDPLVKSLLDSRIDAKLLTQEHYGS